MNNIAGGAKLAPAFMRALACATTCVLLGACAAAAGNCELTAIELPDLERGPQNDDAGDRPVPTIDTSIVPQAAFKVSSAAFAVDGVCEIQLDGPAHVGATTSTSCNAVPEKAVFKAEDMTGQWNAIKLLINNHQKDSSNPGDIVDAAIHMGITSGRLLELLDANQFDDMQLCQVAYKCMEHQDSEFFPVLLQTKSEKHITLLRKVIESDNVFADVLQSTNQTFVNNVLQCLPEMDMPLAKIEEALKYGRCDVAVMSLNPSNMAAGVLLITNYLNNQLHTEDQSKPKAIGPMTALGDSIFQSAPDHKDDYALLSQYDTVASHSVLANALANQRKVSLLVALHQKPEVLEALVQRLEAFSGISLYKLSFPAQLSTSIPLHVATLVLAGLVECSSSDVCVQTAFLDAAFVFKSTITFESYHNYSDSSLAPSFTGVAFRCIETASTSEEMMAITSRLSVLNCQRFAIILTEKYCILSSGAQIAKLQQSAAVAPPMETDDSALLPAESVKPNGLQRAIAAMMQVIMTLVGLPGLFCTEWVQPCWTDCIESPGCREMCCGQKSILKPFFALGTFFALAYTNHYNAVAGFFLGIFLVPLSLFLLASMCRSDRDRY